MSIQNMQIEQIIWTSDGENGKLMGVQPHINKRGV